MTTDSNRASRRVSRDGVEEGRTRTGSKRKQVSAQQRLEHEQRKKARNQKKARKASAKALEVQATDGEVDREESNEQVVKPRAIRAPAILEEGIPGNRYATDNVEAKKDKKKVKSLVKQQQESGSVQTTKAARIVLGGVVRNTLFRKVKFITSHSHLDYGAKVCRIILEKLTIDKNNVALCKKYWILHRSSVNKTLNGKRGNVNNEIKTRFMSMWCLFVCAPLPCCDCSTNSN